MNRNVLAMIIAVVISGVLVLIVLVGGLFLLKGSPSVSPQDDLEYRVGVPFWCSDSSDSRRAYRWLNRRSQRRSMPLVQL